MSDRIAVMSQGRVQQIGTPTEIYDTPASRFVAGFIGNCNLFDGELDVASSRFAIRGVAEVPIVEIPDVSPSTPLTLAVRPERVRVLPEGSSTAGDVEIPAVLEHRVFLGDEWVSHLTLASGAIVSSSVPSGPRARDLAAITEGARVRVSWSPGDARVLPGGDRA